MQRCRVQAESVERLIRRIKEDVAGSRCTRIHEGIHRACTPEKYNHLLFAGLVVSNLFPEVEIGFVEVLNPNANGFTVCDSHIFPRIERPQRPIRHGIGNAVSLKRGRGHRSTDSAARRRWRLLEEASEARVVVEHDVLNCH